MLRALAAVALLMLAACGADNIYADDAAVARARYTSAEAPSITLFTVVSNRTDAGAHSALLIHASESVLFDPAGSFKMQSMPERGDVLFGANPRWVNAYIDYHARDTYHVRSQTLKVSPQVAEELLAAVKARGAVPKANCANSISQILSKTPGFERVRATYYPKVLAAAFGEDPNVVFRKITDQTADKSHGVRFLDKDDKEGIAAAGLTP